MKSPLLVLAICLAGLCQSYALNFRFLAWDDNVAARKLGVVSGENVVPIEDLHPLKRTPDVRVAVGENGVFVRVLDRPDPSGKPTDFKLTMAQNIANPLVIILPDKESPAGLKGFVVEDNTEKFPWGSFRILNVTGGDLGMIYGEKRVLLPATWTPVDIVPADDSAKQVHIYEPADLENPMASYAWKPETTMRRFIIILPGEDPRLGRLALKDIVEIRPDEDGN